MRSYLNRTASFVKRHYLALAAAVSVTGGALVSAGSAMATGAVYSIGGVVTSTQSNISADIPIILGIFGALVAVAWAIRFLFKHIGSPKG